MPFPASRGTSQVSSVHVGGCSEAECEAHATRAATLEVPNFKPYTL